MIFLTKKVFFFFVSFLVAIIFTGCSEKHSLSPQKQGKFVEQARLGDGSGEDTEAFRERALASFAKEAESVYSSLEKSSSPFNHSSAKGRSNVVHKIK